MEMGEYMHDKAVRFTAWLMRPFPTWLLRVLVPICGIALLLSIVRHFDGANSTSFDWLLLLTWAGIGPFVATELHRREG